MHRRTFASGRVAATLAPPRARAQAPARPARVGVLLYSDHVADPNVRAFSRSSRARTGVID